MIGKISIIVPVFNSHRYIERCLQSVLDQTYKNLELIVVDDASTDDTSEKIENIANTDDRVVYLKNNVNQGVHRSRWTGVKQAKGDYISFVDADDWISSKMLEHMVSSCDRHSADICMCGMYNEYDDPSSRSIRQQYEGPRLVTDQLFERFCSWEFGTGSLCNRMYSRDLVLNSACWQSERTLKLNEDYIVNLHCFLHARRVAIIPDIYYYAFVNPESASRIHCPETLLKRAFIAYLEAIRGIESHGEKKLRAVDRLYKNVFGFRDYRVETSRINDLSQDPELQTLIQELKCIRPKIAVRWEQKEASMSMLQLSSSRFLSVMSRFFS